MPHLELPHSDELSLSEESTSCESLMQHSDDESIHDEPLFDKSPTIKTFLLLLNTLETCLDHNFLSCVLMMVQC